VWRLWVHRSDVYLAARIMAGKLKLSLHESGEWISAFTKQSGVIIKETGSRRHKTWRRPPEFTPGWTHGPAVIVPWVAWRDELVWKYENYPDDTEWVPEPKRNKKILFNILFSAAGVKGSAAAVSRKGDRLLDRSLPLANGEAVWLQIRHAEMQPNEVKGIRSTVDPVNMNVERKPKPGSLAATLVWITESPEAGVPVLVQIPLGRRNVRVQSEG
jgi:hypothetical protein